MASDKYCPFCGAVIKPGDTFCGTCGANITTDQPATGYPPQDPYPTSSYPPPPPSAEGYPPPPPQQQEYTYGAPAYPPPPVYPLPVSKNKSTASLAIGFGSLCCFSWLAWILGWLISVLLLIFTIIGIGLGIAGMKEDKLRATIGIVIGVLGSFIQIPGIIITIIVWSRMFF